MPQTRKLVNVMRNEGKKKRGKKREEPKTDQRKETTLGKRQKKKTRRTDGRTDRQHRTTRATLAWRQAAGSEVRPRSWHARVSSNC